MALDTSLSTSAFELERPFAGKELNTWLSAGSDDEAAALGDAALDLVSEVGIGLREVMYDVDKRVSCGCVAMACPSGRRNVMAGAVCVKTVC